MAVRAGQAFISIAPSFKGFKVKTDTWVKTNMRAIDVQVNPVMSNKPMALKPPKPVTVKVDVDQRGFHRSITAIESRLDRLARGRFLVNVGIAFTPVAAPAVAAAAGAAFGLGGIGAAGLAGVVSMATVGAASLKRLTTAQEAVTAASDASATATKGLQSARQSLASAERSAAGTRVAAARAVASAQASAAKQVESAENALKNAQRGLVDSQKKVAEGLADLHEARQQALRDLEDLREKSADNALSTESAEIGLIDAQAELAKVQGDAKATALDLRKAQLGVAEAQNRLSDARREGAATAKELADAEKGGVNANPGVISARKSLKDAKSEEREARQGVRDARRELSEARAEGAKQVAEARADAARQIADSQAAVAAAGADLAEAQRTAAAAQAAQAAALAAMSPSQKAAAAGIDRLKKSWAGFQDATDPFVLPALVAGMHALEKGMAPLAAFMEPVAGAARRMFHAFGDAVASKGFMTWATAFGNFAAVVGGDATQGILNLGRAFGNLFTAFMPLSTDMSSGLVVLTERFANWTAGLEGSDGFNSFVSYVRENGPLLLSTLGEVGLAFIAIGKAAAPLGSQLLEIISSVSRFVVAFAGAHPRITSGAVAFIALSSGVAALAAPLSKVVALFRIATSPISKAALAWKAHSAAVKAGTANTIAFRIQYGLLRAQEMAKNTWAAAKAVGGFVVQQGRLLLAYSRNLIANAAITAGMLAQRAATLVVTAATRAWAAGQWLLNAALTANPIGLVVIALVALGAGLVVMYKKVGWFRDGVDAAWGVLKSGFFWVRDNWQTLAVILGGPIGAAVVVITKNFDTIKTGIGKVKDAFGAAKDSIASVWGKLSDAVTYPLDTIKKALNVFFAGIDWVASKFGMKNVFNFRFHDVETGNGSREGSKGGGNVGTNIKKATGGVLPGWSPGTDIHHFTSPTGGRLNLSGGEAIMRPEWTAAVGGKRAVDAMNKMAMRGGQAFAGGGVFWPTKSKHWTTYAGHDGIDLNGPGNGMGDPYFATADGTVSYTGWGRGYGHKVELNTAGGPTVIYGHSSAVNVKPGQNVKSGQVLGRIGSTGNSTGPHLHFGLLGEPADQGAMAVRYLGGAKMPSGDGGGGSSWNPVADIKKAVLSAKKISSSIESGPFGNMLKKAPGRIGDMAVDWAKDKVNPFDDGGIATARGLLVKDTLQPERVLSPNETSALQAGLRNLSNPETPMRISGALKLVDGEAYIEGIATRLIDENVSSDNRDMRFAQP